MAVCICVSIFMHQLTDHITETGGLFRLISRLMRSEATVNRYCNPHLTVNQDPG